ncbi:MAG: 3-phosphoshikimate 1-carboxyvinyltransferase, partial [Bacteroidia bacterium]|nr:3-phosphoshikimate 1-carboxyvinyltransferase [Bacteroidia bacterium]
NNMYISGYGRYKAKDGSVALTLSHNDHRIAMSLSIASLFTSQRIKIDSIKCIDKSFPSFVEKLRN